MLNKTFIIAEIGINHGGNLGDAKKLISRAKLCGADAVKFQSYYTDKRVNRDNQAYNILKKCELSLSNQVEIIDCADKNSIEFMSTPFDIEHLYFLADKTKRIKIASFDIVNKPFLREVSLASQKYGLEVIMSTGMSNETEISEAVKILAGVENITLLHCVSSYPIPNESELNFSAIKTIQDRFPACKVGYSNHFKSAEVPALAVLAGAKVVECHFMIDDSCADAPVSLDADMFEKMTKQIRRFDSMLGTGELCMKDVEKESIIFRRKVG